MIRRVGYLYGGTGGLNIREIINPWDYKQLRPKPQLSLYKTEKILEFDDHGTYPIYKSNQSYLTVFFKFTRKFIPTSLSWYMLNANPYPFALEPLFMPFFLVYGIIGIWRCFKVLADNALTIYEIRLKIDGIHAEVYLYNFFGLKSKNKIFTIDIRDLKPPPLHPDSIPLKGDLFPHLIEGFEIKNENTIDHWVKYNLGIRRKFFIPKTYSYMQQELMVTIMNGSYIKYIV